MTQSHETSIAYPAQELQDMLMDHFRVLVDYWAKVDLSGKEFDGSRSVHDRLSGLLHSFLVTLDGNAGGFPCAVDLVCRPHPDDKAFNIEEGEQWVEDGTVLNSDTLLHEVLYHHGAWA